MTAYDYSQKKYSLWHNIVASLKLNWRINRYNLIGHIGLMILQVVSNVLTIFFGSRIVGELTHAVRNEPVNMHRMYLWIALSILSIIAERFAWRWMNLLERAAWIRWYVTMEREFNGKLASLDMAQHHDSEFQKVVTKLSNSYQYTPANFANYTFQLFHSVIRLLSSLFIVAGIAPWVLPIMILSLIPNFMTERRLSSLQWGLWEAKGDKNRLAWRMHQYLQEKTMLEETKIFQTKNYILDLLRRLYQDFYGQQLRNIKSIRWPALFSLTFEGIILAGIDVWLIVRVVNHSLSLANFSFYSGIIFQFGSSLSLIVSSFGYLIDNNLYMKDLFKLLDTKPLLPQVEHPTAIPAQTAPSIAFEDVWFKYPGAEHWTLSGVSFSLEPGSKVAFVGENGAGKTTIIRLLLRFYDVDKGKITINGTNITEVDLNSLYHHIGVLFQTFNQYPLSVRDNIAMGRVEHFANDSAVVSAAKSADANSFIEKYPEQYNQILEIGFKKGIDASGGQWQRIALARALFRDANILILDEPTAAVDAKSEYSIFKTLEQHSANKTTIIISHRFSTVRTAAKIYVINHGKIAESGTHKQLMKIAGGLYKEMFEKQAEGYK